MPYDWTPARNASNLAKHGVAFEAMVRFDWATALVVADLRNSQTEIRLNASGMIGDRLHHVTFTIRRTTVWVISLAGRTTRRSHAMKRTIRRNTLEEEAAIQRGIDADPDAQEWTDEMHARAQLAAEVMPATIHAELTAPRRRGPGIKPAKTLVTFRLDRDVVNGLRASGPGWQVRANEALRKLVKG